MFQEFLIAVLKAGLPVGAASYALVWWALRHDYLGEVSSLAEVKKEVKRLSGKKSRREQQENPGAGATNPVHNKWLKFGGGFYGVVALLTYGLIELAEIRDFFLQFNGLTDLFRQLGLGLIIGFLIEAVTNFIIAIAWPVYWLSQISGPDLWFRLAAAYGGYWAGVRLAFMQAKK